MTEDEAIVSLAQEGFAQVYAGREPPHASFAEHDHAARSALIIVDGEMTIIERGATRTLQAGDRLDVPVGAVHAARVGAAGCHYVVGE
jgi:quercetin dioxygenase-like cupin family protein